MRVSGLTWLLVAFLSCPAAADGLGAADRDRLNRLVQGLTAQAAVDLGNCQHEYDDFDSGYIALLDRGESDQLKRLVDHHAIEVKAPENVEHNPTHAQCMEALRAASRIYSENATWIAKLHAELPAIESSEEP
jgi:hypothetical protein